MDLLRFQVVRDLVVVVAADREAVALGKLGPSQLPTIRFAMFVRGGKIHRLWTSANDFVAGALMRRRS
jgi:hypothetical protein